MPALSKLVKDRDEFKIGDNVHVQCVVSRLVVRVLILEDVWQRRAIHRTRSATISLTHPIRPRPAASLQAIPFSKVNRTFMPGRDLMHTQGGCGRFFEGDGKQMHAALSYLGTLPNETVVYNGHEYTRGSVAFGKSIDPTNTGIARLGKLVEENPMMTGLTTIGDEKEWNVFMRLDSEAVK